MNVSYKIVYYGASGAGKTASIEAVFRKISELAQDDIAISHSDLIRLTTEKDPGTRFETLNFHYHNLSLSLFTVPGGLFFNETRLQLLRGAHGIIFVIDSDPNAIDTNRQALDILAENIDVLKIRKLPRIFQYNRRDHPRAIRVARLDTLYNRENSLCFETIATKGIGIFPSLKAIVSVLSPEPKKETIEEAKTVVIKTTETIAGPKRFHGRADYYKE